MTKDKKVKPTTPEKEFDPAQSTAGPWARIEGADVLPVMRHYRCACGGVLGLKGRSLNPGAMGLALVCRGDGSELALFSLTSMESLLAWRPGEDQYASAARLISDMLEREVRQLVIGKRVRPTPEFAKLQKESHR